MPIISTQHQNLVKADKSTFKIQIHSSGSNSWKPSQIYFDLIDFFLLPHVQSNIIKAFFSLGASNLNESPKSIPHFMMALVKKKNHSLFSRCQLVLICLLTSLFVFPKPHIVFILSPWNNKQSTQTMLLGAADTLPRFLNYNCYVLAVFNLRPVLYSAFTRSHLSTWKNGYIAVIPYREKWLYTL